MQLLTLWLRVVINSACSDGPNRKSKFLSIDTNNRDKTSSIYWAQLSRFHLKTKTESSLRNIVFLNKRQDEG
jgi:hypothetical protein